jgi:hydrogenase expression/formation protein HypE
MKSAIIHESFIIVLQQKWEKGKSMKIGKVNETILKRSVFKQLHKKRDEVILGPSVGEDCAMVTFSEDELCVISTDPITGTTKDIGSLAVHVTINDLAANGSEPIGILLTILLPEGFAEEKLKAIMTDVNRTCDELGIDVLGGHTEVTRAVNQPIINVTGIGKANKNTRVINSEAGPDMDVIMTKWAGVEGTAIIAAEKEVELRAKYHGAFVDRALDYKSYISVLPESRIALRFNAAAMHDATEGGVFGALWELGASANLGLEIRLDAIPIRQETIEICEHFNMNPYKLISSGVLLIISPDGQAMTKALIEAGIDASIIGKTTEAIQRVVIGEDTVRSLEPAKADELYKVI